LKKRRFSMMSNAQESSKSDLAILPEGTVYSLSEGKLAALSLIASTAAAVPLMQEIVPDAMTEEDSSSLEDQSTDPEDDGESSLAKDSDESQEDAPLPGGCHGRTSRSNNYCRRGPCYRGSQFCKLHYQQHVLSETSKSQHEETCNPVASSVSPPPSEKKQGSVQDKRYTGTGDEVRCKATTTRGRKCAYISVSGHKYCNLHADYDTNPPPRRGGGGVKKSPAAIFRTKALETSEESLQEKQPSGKVSTGRNESVSVRLSMSSDRSKRRSAAKLAKKHMDAPFPLLSMISTDQWAKKRVKISVGPLSDRIGVVQKWSNGWVSVKVDGVGLHNRRSFELYLLTDTKDDPQPAVSSETQISKKARTSRVTPSPTSDRRDSGSLNSTRTLAKLSPKPPVTPRPGDVARDCPTTPSASRTSDLLAPFVPSVTPNSPRKPLASSDQSEQHLSEGLLLSDPGESGKHLRQRLTISSSQAPLV